MLNASNIFYSRMWSVYLPVLVSGYGTCTNSFFICRMCHIEPGEVVCDPMCGGGSIPIEAAINWPSARHICGDNHELAAPRAAKNIAAVNVKRSPNRR